MSERTTFVEQDRYILFVGRGLSNNRKGLAKGKTQLDMTKTITYGDKGIKNIKNQPLDELDIKSTEEDIEPTIEDLPELTEQEKTYLYQKYGTGMPSRQHFDNLVDYMKKDKKLTKQEATEIMRDIIYKEKHKHHELPKRNREKNKYHYEIKFKD